MPAPYKRRNRLKGDAPKPKHKRGPSGAEVTAALIRLTNVYATGSVQHCQPVNDLYWPGMSMAKEAAADAALTRIGIYVREVLGLHAVYLAFDHLTPDQAAELLRTIRQDG